MGHVTLTMTRIMMDEVEWMQLYKATRDLINSLPDDSVVRSITTSLIMLIGNLNDRVTELQLDDPDD